MSDDPQPASVPLLVHGLLVCRNVEPAGAGALNLHEVLEVIALDEIPGDAGPLAFVAFIRNLPEGPGRCAFVVRPAGVTDHETARLPLEVVGPPEGRERQMAVQMRLASVPVKQGGWYELTFEWEGETKAATLFAIGARGPGTSTEDA